MELHLITEDREAAEVKIWQSKFFIVSGLTLIAAVTTLSLTAVVSQRGSRADVHAIQNENHDKPEPSVSESKNKAMNNKPMSQEDLVELLKEGKKKGYITGNLPSDPDELEALAQRIRKDMVYEQSGEGEIGTESGRQQLILKCRLAGDWDDSTDLRLPLFFEGSEWSAVFREVLHAKDRDPFVPGEAIDKWSERQRIRFQDSLAQYPMLARIWDTYTDVAYQPEEIYQLRDECLRVKASTSNPLALRGMDKLIAACNEALKIGSGVLLMSD